MERSGARRVTRVTHLGDLAGGPCPVEIDAVVVSPNVVTSPMSGLRAALIELDVREHVADGLGDEGTSLGTVVLGDLLTLRTADGFEVLLVARRVQLLFVLLAAQSVALSQMLPEIVPLLTRSKGKGVLGYRENALSEGDEVRLRAVVEAVPASRFGTPEEVPHHCVVRDDLAPVVLQQLGSRLR